MNQPVQDKKTENGENGYGEKEKIGPESEKNGETRKTERKTGRREENKGKWQR